MKRQLHFLLRMFALHRESEVFRASDLIGKSHRGQHDPPAFWPKRRQMFALAHDERGDADATTLG